MRKYAGRIERNEINPHIRYDEKTSGLILDPLQEFVVKWLGLLIN
jgi:hypothetical protein